MNNPNVGSESSKRYSALAIIGVALIGLAIGAGVVYWETVGTRTEDNSGEPQKVTYVMRFREAQLIDDTQATRDAFVAALEQKKGKAAFRHNMVIVDKDALGNLTCDKTSLPNAGLNHPSPVPDPCKILPDMGQQVTQRVGFYNHEKLNEALAFLTNTPEP